MAEPAGLLPGDPRARLAMALILAFGFAAVGQVGTVPALLALALILALVAGQPARLLRGLRGPLVLAAAFVLILPLVSGATVLWQAGPLRLRAEGLEAGLLIAGRLLAIVTVTLTLLATLPAHRLAAALRGLGSPALLADLLLLTLRYLDEVRGEILRARLARRLRGGGAGWRDLPGHGAMLALALIRSQRRAENIWAAMRLRGHAAGLAVPPPPLGASDRAGIAVAAGLAGLLLLMDRVA
ncbi:MAG: cobalt ECF transporter T component CbiQ [Chromatiaceae bacterium]|nr:MAG: cobalt ECF transporter T component CbiQ [Chromatiaceae bacterium]